MVGFWGPGGAGWKAPHKVGVSWAGEAGAGAKENSVRQKPALCLLAPPSGVHRAGAALETHTCTYTHVHIHIQRHAHTLLETPSPPGHLLHLFENTFPAPTCSALVTSCKPGSSQSGGHSFWFFCRKQQSDSWACWGAHCPGMWLSCHWGRAHWGRLRPLSHILKTFRSLLFPKPGDLQP